MPSPHRMEKPRSAFDRWFRPIATVGPVGWLVLMAGLTLNVPAVFIVGLAIFIGSFFACFLLFLWSE